MAPEENDIPDDLKVRYSDFRFLGSGAMGRVYKANDSNLSKDVAIKLLLSNQKPEVLVRFQREAKTASKLKHRNLVTIMDFGITSGGQPYLVMEYVEGRTLSSLLQDGPLTLSDSICIVSQICDGMSHAHSLGVIHRDLKPENILVEGDNLAEAAAKVVDFGIAKLGSSAGQEVTGHGKVIGTPLYMSPEQISSSEIDGRSDIYSIGCILFHMLTGRTPYQCESAIELLTAKLNSGPPRVNEIGEHSPVPTALEDVVARCLASDPHDRFASTHELKDALYHASDRSESTSGASTEVASTQSAAKKIAIFATVVLVGVLMIFIVWTRLNPVETPHSETVKAAPTAVFRGTKLTESTELSAYFNKIPRKPSTDPITSDSSESWIASPRVPDEAVKMLVDQDIDVVDLELENQDLITPRAFRYLAKLPNLRFLTLAGSAVSDECLRHLGKSKSLTKINLTGTAVSDAGVAWLTKLPLTALDLDGTKVTNQAMVSVAKMKSLKRLVVSHVKKFDNDGLKLISSLPLTLLYLEYTNVSDDGMKDLPGKHTLTHLFIGQTLVGEPGLRHISSYPLTLLYMEGCKNVDDRCVEFIANTWPNLTALRLSDNKKIKAKGIQSIARLRQLAELKIGALNLSDEDLAPIFELKNMEELSLRGLPITDKTLKLAANLTKLKSLDLTHCTVVTENGIAFLKERMPNLMIIQPEQTVQTPGMVEMYGQYPE